MITVIRLHFTDGTFSDLPKTKIPSVEEMKVYFPGLVLDYAEVTEVSI